MMRAEEQAVADAAPSPAYTKLGLRCPTCRSESLIEADGQLLCVVCAIAYPVVTGRPVLLRPDNALFRLEDYVEARPQGGRTRRYVPDLAVNLSATRVLGHLRQLLDQRGRGRVLVVGGGKQRDWLNPLINSSGRHDVVYSDVDTKADVDVFCDAHDLPFQDASFDAVVTTAVLEHVLYPERVASEVARVVKDDGLLYSELPFIQQVHEGAYDFTRFTLSGHKRLFNRFEIVDAGLVAGPASALAWSIENFVLAFFRGARTRRIAKGVVRYAFFWLKHIDHLLKDRPAAMDGACCTYILGRRAREPISDRAIIDAYVGAKHLSHS